MLCTGLGCQEGWESSANEAAGQFLTPLGNNGGYGFSSTVPVDPINNGAHTSYDTVIATEGLYEFVYYVYPAGSNGCDVNKGQYYIVGAVRTEMTNRNPIQGSPGFQCGTRDWKYEMAWVSGAFAN